jgi:hypothetical protein
MSAPQGGRPRRPFIDPATTTSTTTYYELALSVPTRPARERTEGSVAVSTAHEVCEEIDVLVKVTVPQKLGQDPAVCGLAEPDGLALVCEYAAHQGGETL